MADACNATNSNSICQLEPGHEGRHFDPRNGHSWAATLVVDDTPFKTPDIVGTHVEHCCSIHGCKYATSQSEENECPVANGTLQQAAPCEACQWSDDAIKQAPDSVIAEELIRRGYPEAAALIA